MKRNSGKLLVILTFAAFLTGCNSHHYTQKQAKHILASVEKKYKSLKNFELDASVNTTISRAGQNKNLSYPVSYSREEPGKFRIYTKRKSAGMLHVTNGNTTWNYVPDLQEYTRKQSSMLNTADISHTVKTDLGGTDALMNKLVTSNKTITKNLKRAKILDEESFKLGDGSKRRAYKIRVKYVRPRREGISFSPNIYLIDKKTHLVLRRLTEMQATEQAPNGPYKVYQSFELEKVDLSPSFADDHFVFHPPEGAQKVARFSDKRMQKASSRNPLIGKKAINFNLTSFNGKQINLKDLRGKVILLDFWATWCGPCRRAHPNLQALYKQFKSDGFVVLGINSETARKVDAYMQANHYTFTNLKDPNKMLAKKYHVQEIPSVFIINRKGKVSTHLLGYQPKKRLKKEIRNAGL